jgi:hypothetical protein
MKIHLYISLGFVPFEFINRVLSFIVDKLSNVLRKSTRNRLKSPCQRVWISEYSMATLFLLDYGFCSPILKGGRAKNTERKKKKELSNI